MLLLEYIIILAGLWMLKSQATDASEFECFIQHDTWLYPAYIRMTWSLPEQIRDTRRNDEDYRTNVSWYNFVADGKCDVTTTTSCRCNYGSHNAMNFETKFNLSVTITTGEGLAFFEREWEVDPVTCYKPPKINEVTSSPINSTCAQFIWMYYSTTPTFCSDIFTNKLYQVSYMNIDSGFPQREKIPFPLTKSCHGNYTVCGLHPYTRYEIGIQAKKGGYNNTTPGHWSDIKTTVVTTLEDVPRGVAEMTLGGYTFVTERCGEETGKRTVTIYWKDVVADLKNGIIRSFYVAVYTLMQNKRRLINRLHRSGRDMSCDVILSCDNAYFIEVTAATAIGLSQQSSNINIPKHKNIKTTIIDVIPEIIQDKHHMVNVSWTTTTSTSVPLNNVTVYSLRCLSTYGKHCKGIINWTHVLGSTSSVVLEFSPAQPLHLYKFGVSTVNGVIVWTYCQYSQSASVPVPQNVRLDKTKSHSLLVTWEQVPCVSRVPGPYIVQFVIHVCSILSVKQPMCTGNMTSYTVDQSAISYLLSDLDPTLTYKGFIVAVGRDNKTSLPSVNAYYTPLTEKTFWSVMHPVIWVLLATAAIGCAIFILIIIRKVRNHIEQLIERYKVKMPPNMDVHKIDEKKEDTFNLVRYDNHNERLDFQNVKKHRHY